MKLAWFTPFENRSAIGYYSKLACEALSENNQITIYTHNKADLHETSLTVKYFENTDVVAELKGFDAVIYNMGDNSVYHNKIFDVLKQHRGAVILHDISVINFVYGYYMNYQNNPDEFINISKAYYGEDDAINIYKSSSDAKLWNSLDTIKYNYIQLITKYCNYAIVHSNYHLEILKKEYLGPSRVIYFPYKSFSNEVNYIDKNKKLNLLTVGYVNPNKRVSQIIEAIGTNEKLKQNIVYNIAGKLDGAEYEDQIRHLIKKYRLDNIVILEGFTKKEKLEKLYTEADILINLRKPAMEGASWSLVEQMDTGKPIIVNDVGFYGEIPDECLIKISDSCDFEIINIQKALINVIDNFEDMKLIGISAKKYLNENFSQEMYNYKFNEALEHLTFLKPLENLLDVFETELMNIGLNNNLNIVTKFSLEMETLYF